MADDSDSSDEWGVEDLNVPKTVKETKMEASTAEDDEGYWDTPKSARLEETKITPPTAKPVIMKEDDHRPMILVDMTLMTNDKIHSKFDRNSVNDVVAASNLRKLIEHDYDAYAKHADFLADGTVIPCGMSVWREALTRLRDERPGHYFAPIFPP